MATRIVVFAADGSALAALDGHHGAEQAARWIAATGEQLNGAGIAWLAVEITPAIGGDDFRRGVVGRLHDLRATLHTTPAGMVELAGIGCGVRPVHGGLRVVAAHESLPFQLHALRMPRGRQSSGDSVEQQRLARRLSRAQRRFA